MKFDQGRILPFNKQKVWDLLLNMQRVKTLIPYITDIEEKENSNNSYTAYAALVVGPLTGKLSADLSIVDKKPTDSFSGKILYSSFLGKAIGDIDVQLSSLSPKQTKLIIKGTVKMTGLLGAIGYRIQPETVDSLMEELFNRILSKLRTEEGMMVS